MTVSMVSNKTQRAGATLPRVWHQPTTTTPFIASATFSGAIVGYAFRDGPSGNGYYLDADAPQAPGTFSLGDKQRLLDSRLSNDCFVLHQRRAINLTERKPTSHFQLCHKKHDATVSVISKIASALRCNFPEAMPTMPCDSWGRFVSAVVSALE